MLRRPSIPVIDLFAGPGGLGEGFASLKDEMGDARFDVRVSIEKDPVAHRTLSLRALFRCFPDGEAPDCYYDYVRGDIAREELFAHPAAKEHGERAFSEARCAELGKTPHAEIDAWIREAVGGTGEWVLIGGPPCQAYSLAGRSRLRPGNAEAFESDKRHFLYTEYLRIVRLFNPSVFVMENVKGMLNSQHGGSPIFNRILADLRSPGNGSTYSVRSLVADGDEPDPIDFLVESEKFGVPQRRHRVILFGVRSDVARASAASSQPPQKFKLRAGARRATVEAAIGDLPPLRSRLSRRTDSHRSWRAAVRSAPSSLKLWRLPIRVSIEREMLAAWVECEARVSPGASFVLAAAPISQALGAPLRAWLRDRRLGGVAQHESRSHMEADLHRYLFASCFAKIEGYSPKIRLFPPKLVPHHANMRSEQVPFLDRFRVQVADEPASTVVSHISKDGHYFIHPDPSQCRSLTVREAARLQTFPDNYFFEGTRTQQYHQVGNAVPPWLARQIAEVVSDLMLAARR